LRRSIASLVSADTQATPAGVWEWTGEEMVVSGRGRVRVCVGGNAKGCAAGLPTQRLTWRQAFTSCVRARSPLSTNAHHTHMPQPRHRFPPRTGLPRAVPVVSAGAPGCQPSQQREQKTKRQRGHCAHESSSSRAKQLQRGQYAASVWGASRGLGTVGAFILRRALASTCGRRSAGSEGGGHAAAPERRPGRQLKGREAAQRQQHGKLPQQHAKHGKVPRPGAA
jgi:hypothetical protein